MCVCVCECVCTHVLHIHLGQWNVCVHIHVHALVSMTTTCNKLLMYQWEQVAAWYNPSVSISIHNIKPEWKFHIQIYNVTSLVTSSNLQFLK